MTTKPIVPTAAIMVPNAGWMGAAAILSEMQDRMTLSF
jgi:hypothetical protein